MKNSSIEKVIENYEILLFDAWGVLVEQGGPRKGAVELVEKMNMTGKTYEVVTNDASTLPENLEIKFKKMGLRIDRDRIFSSGMMLEDYFQKNGLKGAGCVVLGPSDSDVYVQRAGGEVVGYEDDFEVLVVADEAGVDFFEEFDVVLGNLFRMLEKDGPVSLVLPNPDIIFPKGDGGFGITAGGMALLFEEAISARFGRKVLFDRLGKPYGPIFEAVGKRHPKGSMVMIGDQLSTDIRGAELAGIDSVFVRGGICTDKSIVVTGIEPTWAIDGLADF